MDAIAPSYAAGPSCTPLLYQTIGQNLKAAAARFPDQDAVVSLHQGVRFSYAAFDAVTDDLAKGLLALGVSKGDRVGIWSVNRWEWIAVQFATAKIGAVLVNINPAYRTHELKYALNQSEASTLILMERFKNSAYLTMLKELCPTLSVASPGHLASELLPFLKTVILMDAEEAGCYRFDDLCAKGSTVSDAALASAGSRIDPDDDINIQYTSGTTGFPKGVTLTHFNILNNGRQVGDVLHFTEKDRLCIPVPFYHCFGMVLSNLACSTHGSAMVIPAPLFDAEAVFAAIERERCTALHGVPTMFITELNHPAFDRYDLSSLRTGIMAGAPCPIETMQDLMKRMHLSEITIAYGQTEASPVTTMTRISDCAEKRVNSVGTVMPWQELKIIDPETGRTVARGVQGEICFRGYNIMSRYYNNPQATAEAIDPQRWLHSGDLGVMDEEGYIKITGRIKEMVIRGGENIYPREIEEFLRANPKVIDVYVVGVPDEKFGEELMAWILLREGCSSSAEDMREYCKGKITHFKIPRYWKFVSGAGDFPQTVTGKIQKFKMREQAIEELGLAKAARIRTA